MFLEISRAFFRFVARITHIYLRLFSCSNLVNFQHVEEFSNAAAKRESFIATTRKLCDRRKKTAILVRSNPGDVVQVNLVV